MAQYLFIFSLNWFAECVVIFVLLPRAGFRRVLVTELILNLTTHPLLWYGLLRLPGPYLRNLFAAEAMVALVEASMGVWLYSGCASRKRIVFAVVMANALTFLMTFLY